MQYFLHLYLGMSPRPRQFITKWTIMRASDGAWMFAECEEVSAAGGDCCACAQKHGAHKGGLPQTPGGARQEPALRACHCPGDLAYSSDVALPGRNSAGAFLRFGCQPVMTNMHALSRLRTRKATTWASCSGNTRSILRRRKVRSNLLSGLPSCWSSSGCQIDTDSWNRARKRLTLKSCLGVRHPVQRSSPVVRVAVSWTMRWKRERCAE